MKIKKYKKYYENETKIVSLQYYIFDIDDNLLFMDTKLHFQHFEDGKWVAKDITSSDFAGIRKKYPDNYMDNSEWRGDSKSFINFGDIVENSLMNDAITAIKNKNFGPSWNAFLRCLKEGRLFAIVTSRGHEPQTIKSVVRYIINNVLSKEEFSEMYDSIQEFNNFFNIETTDIMENYLNSCYFMGITSNAFISEYQYSPKMKMNQGKQDCINKFTNWVRGFAQKTKLPLSVSFSDDDVNFTNSAKELFMNMEKSLDFPEIFYVFDTSNKSINGGIKVQI